MARTLGLAFGLALTVFSTSCDNPADDAQKADVGEPVEASPADGGTEPSTAQLAISGADSTIGFVGSKVTGSHEGGFKSFEGTVSLSKAAEVTGVTVEIDMTSTWSDNERLTGHLKSPDFFDVEKFPTAKFESTEVQEGAQSEKMPDATHTVTGNLTLHGVTKSITFAAKIDVSEQDLTAKSDFAINRKDFGIEYPGKPDDLIRDEVVIKLSIRASRA